MDKMEGHNELCPSFRVDSVAHTRNSHCLLIYEDEEDMVGSDFSRVALYTKNHYSNDNVRRGVFSWHDRNFPLNNNCVKISRMRSAPATSSSSIRCAWHWGLSITLRWPAPTGKTRSLGSH